VRRLCLPAGFVLLAISCSAGSPTVSPASHVEVRRPSSAPALPPAPVVLVVMENHSYGQIVGNAAAPYLNRFASRGTLFTRMQAVSHPSLPNYLALTAGSTLGCASDGCPARFSRAGNVFHQLAAAGSPWRSWQESMLARCVLHDASPYVLHHNPPPYYRDLFPRACPRHDRPYPRPLPKRIPGLTFITPNACHDMHDCSVGVGDAWLRSHVPPLLRRGAIVVITFDEGIGNNHIYCAARGPGIEHGVRRQGSFTHYSVLAWVERHFGLSRLRLARSARPLSL